MFEMNPTAAFTLALVGLLGIYCEFIWPGRVVPGLAGSILVLGGIYTLTRSALNPVGLMLLGLAMVLFAAEAFWKVDFISGLLATASLTAASCVISTGRERVQPALAVPACVVFGAITVLLCLGAKRARRNKWSDLL